jgi:hypothetical protein
VQKAVTPGAVTLLTRAFGRGTDFICYDDHIQQNGGVHVIQTFVSQLVSEEVQIKGRTARQGNKGSFSMVLHPTDLEKIGIKASDVESLISENTVYSEIVIKRNESFETLFPDNMKFVDEIREDHVRSVSFLGELARNKAIIDENLIRSIKAQLVVFNTRIGEQMSLLTGPDQRTLCLMDATGSMRKLLEKAKNTVHVMFERTNEILREKNIMESFEVQFAVYRNYSSGPQKIFLASPWATEPSEIRTFMNTIHPDGGQGNEAVEIGLNYAVKEDSDEKPLTQVLLIGDMRPNTKEEVATKRTGINWRGTPYETPTFYRDEVARLKAKGIPVHTFYLQPSAKAVFEWIAAETGGKSSFLNIDTPLGAEVLTGVVTRQILTAGRSAEISQELISAYEAKYGFSGHVSASK